MALSSKTFDYAGGAVSDLFSRDAYKAKAAGAAYEQKNYMLASEYADKNAQYAEWSTSIKQAQNDRTLFKSLGQTSADVAGAGFAQKGSALDILRESASQGALTHAVTGEQGLIQQEGYRQQAESYRNMAAAAQVSIDAENKAADNALWTAGIKGAAAVASLFIP